MAEMTDEQIAESVRTYTKRRVDDGDSIREWDFCDICGNQQFDRDHSSHSPTTYAQQYFSRSSRSQPTQHPCSCQTV
jgi:hypothetical protein